MKNENVFPLVIYPEALQQFILSANEHKSYPINYMAVSALMAFVTATGNTRRLRFQEGFYGIASIYCVLIGAAGACKSHPISTSFAPIEGFTGVSYREFEQQQVAYNQSIAGKKKADNNGITPLEKPRLVSPIVKDYTHEMLLQLLYNNPKGLTLLIDEIISFFDNLDRYSKSSNQQAYNTLWNGESWSVNRVNSDSFRIPNTVLSVFGTIQTKLLDRLFSKGKSESGLAARFLFCTDFDASIPLLSGGEIDQKVQQQYHSAIESLLHREIQLNAEDVPIVQDIELSTEARSVFLKWRNGVHITDIEENRDSPLAEAFIKMDTYALRFALVLHEINNAYSGIDSETVAAETMQNAIKLVNFFKDEAQKVYGIVFSKDITIKMTEEQKQVYALLKPEFEIRLIAGFIENQTGMNKNRFGKFVRDNKDYFENIGWGKYKKLYIPEV